MIRYALSLMSPISPHPSHHVPDADLAIEVHGLRKRYGAHEAVRGIDLEVRRGEIFAFLGPNGAGKTTTVEILEGFRRAGDGTVRVLGADPWHAPAAWRARIGIVLQESEAEPGLTARECLELYAGYYRAPRGVTDTLALVGLDEQADERATELSGGQRRRLDVALALIGDPELVFLDEPTTGFDPAARRAAWDVIDGLRRLGKTIFLTTHYMEEAERLADRVAVLRRGKIVAQGTPRTLGDRAGAASRITLPAGAPELPAELADRARRDDQGRVEFDSTGVAADLRALSDWALERGVSLDELEIRRPTLEDVYLALTTDDPPEE
jgi:ABC-2 type transport system ATP-binding protein